ncbi:glycosyltransferase family 4 protein [Phnomibacter sp. MR]|uniref:glycosyltransferase family 4 protein n=1 Tax=Phnomibacter sp. MR TaxID=3042318 RepID=UPI003A813253
MKSVCAVHLLNDFSGSPFVFRQALEALQKKGYSIDIYTATPARGGFLSGLPNARYHSLYYKHSSNKWMTLLRFFIVQLQLFFSLLFSLRREQVVYVNTLLPAGAALAASIRGCKVVYHVHEVSITPVLLKNLLAKVVAFTATDVVFVSNYVASCYHFRRPQLHTVYNALSNSFVQQAAHIASPNMRTPFTVLMLCSLKAYKGVHEFLQLASALPAIRFQLVLNADEKQVEDFKKQHAVPHNCMLFSTTTHTLAFYEQAHLVVNFSNPDEWVETFGLTLLEAMACGRPVIAPPVGGPVELVRNGVEGFCIDARQVAALQQAVQLLYTDVKKYIRFSENARRRAAAFSTAAFEAGVSKVFASASIASLQPNDGKHFQNVETAVAEELQH